MYIIISYRVHHLLSASLADEKEVKVSHQNDVADLVVRLDVRVTEHFYVEISDALSPETVDFAVGDEAHEYFERPVLQAVHKLGVLLVLSAPLQGELHHVDIGQKLMIHLKRHLLRYSFGNGFRIDVKVIYPPFQICHLGL